MLAWVSRITGNLDTDKQVMGLFNHDRRSGFMETAGAVAGAPVQQASTVTAAACCVGWGQDGAPFCVVLLPPRRNGNRALRSRNQPQPEQWSAFRTEHEPNRREADALEPEQAAELQAEHFRLLADLTKTSIAKSA